MRARALLVVIALALATALGYAVNVGWAQAMDAYTVHLMPWRACPYHPQSSADQLIAPLPAAVCHSRPPYYEPPAAGRAAFAVASTAAPAMTLVLVLALAVLAARGRRWRILLAGVCAVAAATFVEIIGKLVVTRPPIMRVIHTHHVALNTAHSFPCGHTIRACIVVYLVVALRPRWAATVLVWFAAVQVALATTSGHTPTDLGGGLLVGVAIAATMSCALGRPKAPARVAAPLATA